MGVEGLNGFFNPKTIAVIGASNRPDSLGAQIFHNLLESYAGSVFPVNPFRPTIQGIAAYPSINRIPITIDLAIIATPAHTIPQIVEECGKANVQSIIIVSAGLSANDADGQELSRQILEHKKNYKIRIIGPSSLGIIRPKTNLYATFAEKKVITGKIAFISQSAAACGLILDWSAETQVGLSGVVSTGASLDVDIADLVDYFGADPQTRIIMLYVESIKDIRSFLSAVREFARTKPVVLLKAGHYNENRYFNFPQANKLVTEDALYDAAFRRVGAVRVETLNQLFDCAKTLSLQPNPTENNVTIITNASGPALMAVDCLIAQGGSLSRISNISVEKLTKIMPRYCSISNPIDVLEEATPERFRKVLQICVEDPSVKNLLVIYTPLGKTIASTMSIIIIELAKQTRKNFLVCLMGEDTNCQEARRSLQRSGIPAFRIPEEAVNTFMYTYTYTQNLELLYQTPTELSLNVNTPNSLKATIRRVFCEGRKFLNLLESLSFLEAYAVPTVNTRIASNAEDATEIASEIGYPVVMKPLLSSMQQPIEDNELELEACSPSDVSNKFDILAKKINKFDNTPTFFGIAIQPKTHKNLYQISIGSRKDSRFGPLIFLGKAGNGQGCFKELSVGFPPLNQILAKQILENAKYLHQKQANRITNRAKGGLLEQLIVNFSQLVTDFPEILEVEAILVVVNEKNIFAIDAHITIDRDRIIREVADHHEHMIIAPYPREYAAIRTLKNGAQVKLRPIKPEDEMAFSRLFKSLSEESIRLRFFETIKEMSHDTLAGYCNLDYDREIAIVAELQNERRIIGAVRLVLDSGKKAGEFAIMVGDLWQGLGLGAKLMDHIIDIAGGLKLETIYSHVTRANIKMINMCTKKGFEIKPVDEYTINMSKTILPHLDSSPPA